MSKQLERLKSLKNKPTSLPKSDFITRAGGSDPKPPRQEPTNTASAQPASQAEKPTKKAVEPKTEPKPATSASITNTKLQDAVLSVAFKVPKSRESDFNALVQKANLPVKSILQALSGKFIPEFRKTADNARPERDHIEPFGDNVPKYIYRTTFAMKIGEIDHIDALGLLQPKTIYEHWAQWEFVKFLQNYLDSADLDQ